MSAANRDHTSPYKRPNKLANRRRYERPADLRVFSIRQIGESLDQTLAVKAATLETACLRFAEIRWANQPKLKEMVYAKIEGERYLRCIDPEGRVEIMGW